MTAPSESFDRSGEDEQRKLAKFASRAFIVGAITSGIASLVDSNSGLFTSWDNYLTATISVVCLISGLTMYFRPQWLTATVLLAITPWMIYQQGVMYLAIHQPSAASLYSATSGGPFFPLIFVVLFVTLRKGASTLSWFHCAGFYVQFLLNTTWLSESLPSPGRLRAEHLLVEAMMAYPIYILALNYIVKLRERLHAIHQEAFKHKEDFLGMLSHEIRNQLKTMVGGLEFLDFKLKDPVERRSFERLQKATMQLQTYLNDINELTMLEDPELKIEKSPFDLTRLIDDIRDEWLPQAIERGLQLNVQARGDGNKTLLFVNNDEARLRQIISNLISNALKYTDTGWVTVAAYPCTKSPGSAVIEVIDTGIGIDEKFLHKIFLPHVRLDNAPRRRAAGSGLGLTIVQHLVARLGGSLHVESQLNRGTKFQIAVPGLIGKTEQLQERS